MRFTQSIFFVLALCLCLPVFAQTTDRQVIAGMVLKNDKAKFDSKAFFATLKTEWKVVADSVSEKDGTLVFISGNAVVMLANMDYAVPTVDLAAPAGISWLWKNAETEALRNQSHLVISVIGGTGQATALHKLFTKVTACALANSNSSGIFMNSQYLLIPKGYYIEAARNMTDATLPIYLWVYFGLLQDKGMSSGYTYGLTEFGMNEIEIVDSQMPVQEAHAFLYDVTHEVILYNKHLKDGDKVSGSENQQVTVRLSPAKFLEGNTVKLSY
jgi:hypothetical protein